MKRKKLLVICMLCTVMIVGVTSTSYGALNPVGFYFRIPAYQANGHEADGRYRQTIKPTNPWAVALVKSGEGSGTITQFWLEVNNGTNVSKAYSTKCNGTLYSHPAYSSASERTVYLTAQNNNNNGVSYVVDGVWDEDDLIPENLFNGNVSHDMIV